MPMFTLHFKPRHLLSLIVIAGGLIGCAPSPIELPPPTATVAFESGAPVLPTRTPLEPTVPPPTLAPRQLPVSPTPTAEAAGQYYKSGLQAYARKEYMTALLDFTQAIQLDKRNALLYWNRAQVYLAQGDLDGAIADFSTVIELDPGNIAAWVHRGEARAGREEYALALLDLDHAISLSPNEPSVYVNRGRILQASGNISTSIEFFSRAL